jgi:hypothetical protein
MPKNAQRNKTGIANWVAACLRVRLAHILAGVNVGVNTIGQS